MAYGPAEIGIQQSEQRPYGQTAQEIEDARKRRQAEEQGAPATPRGPVGPAGPAVPTPGPPMRSPTQIGAPRTTEGLDTSAIPKERQAAPPTQAAETVQRGVDALGETIARRRQQSEETRTHLGEIATPAFVYLRDTLANVFSFHKPSDFQTPEEKAASQADYAARTKHTVGGGVGAAATFIGTPFEYALGEVHLSEVQSNPQLSSEWNDIVDSLPPDQRRSPKVRADVASAVLDSATARLLHAIDDPSFSESEKRAATAAASLLVAQRFAEFGGPQAGRYLLTRGINAAAEAAGTRFAGEEFGALKPPGGGEFEPPGAKPGPAYAIGRDATDAKSLISTAQRLRAVGAVEDAKAVEQQIADLTSGLVPEGVASRGDLHALEDLIGAKQSAGYYAGREAMQTTEMARLARLRQAVETRETALADAGGDPFVDAPEKPGAGSSTSSEGAKQEPAPPEKPPAEPPAARGAEPPTFPSEEPNLGINFDKIDAPDSVKEIIRVEAMANLASITAQRRGVQSLDVIFARAKNLGIDVPDIAQVRAGTAFNAEGAVSIFNAIVKTANRRLALEEQIRAAGIMATPEQEARWLAAVYEQNTLQRVFAGGRAEAGRSMRALRELASGVNSGRMQDTFARALDAIGGKANFDKLLQRLKDIQTNPNLTPYQREIAATKFVGSMHKARFWDKMNEIFINSILSHPLTHQANVLGQTALFEADALAQLPAAMFDAVVSGATGRARTRTMQGAIVQAVAGHAAMKRALAEGLLYMKTGISAESVEKFRESGVFRGGQALQDVGLTDARTGKTATIPIGTAMNLPTRALGAEDVVFNRLGYQRQLWQDAANYVLRDKGEHVFSRSTWRRIADVADHPEDFLMEGKSISSRAEEAGRRAGLRQDAGELAQLLTRIRDIEIPKTGGLAPGKYITPFVRIGFNLARVGTEYSPLGFVRVATTRGGTQADAFGRAVIGSGLWWFFWSAADSGNLTGAAPSDPVASKDFYDSGKRPYAIKVGNTWVEYSRYEPIATTLKWVHGMHEAAKDVQDGIQDPRLFGSALGKATGTMARSLTDSSYLTGLQDFYSIATASDAQINEKLARFAGNLANSFIPYSGARRYAAQTLDPTLRHPTGFMEQIEAATPGLSQSMQPYLTHWGEDVQRPERVGGVIASQQTQDPVDAVLATVLQEGKLNIDGTEMEPQSMFVTLAQQDIAGLKLSSDEGFMLQQTAGRAAHVALADLFSGKRQVKTEDGNNKYWGQMNDREKLQATQATISEARRTARATVADAILLSSTTDDQVKRGARMRLATISKVSDRASFLAALDRQGKLTTSVREYLDRTRGKGERTVSEYLRLARGG